MADELGAELSLDLDSARREIESFRRDVEDELDRAVTNFADSYANAVSNLPDIEPTVAADAVTEELNRAVTATDAVVSPETDTATIQSSIVDAVDNAPAVVNADTDPLVASLIDVVEATHPTFTPTLDTTEVEAALAGLGDEFGGIDVSGLEDAQLNAQELSDTLGDLQEQSTQTSDGLGATSNVSTTLATAFSAAKGDGRQLLGSLGQLGGGFGPVIAGATGAAIGFTALFEAGERSIAALERVKTVLGADADAIEHIDVGGLRGDLSTLAVQAGVSTSALRTAAASAAQVGIASGASKPQVIEFANSVNALALRAVAMNPALGDAGAVAERLNIALARGGRFLNRYGLDLNAAEISTRALANTGKSSVRELTFFERSVAGAQLAVEQLGTSLGTDFQRGTDQSSVALKRIKAELASAFASAGKPLVQPTIDALDNLAEVGTEVSVVLGQVGTAAIPVLKAIFVAAGALVVPLGLLSDLLGAIPQPILTAVVALGAMRLVMGPLTTLFDRMLLGVDLVSTRTGIMTGAIETNAKGQAVLTERLRGVGTNLAAAAAAAIVASTAFDGMGHSAADTVVGITSMTIAGAELGAAVGQPGLGAAIGFTIGVTTSLTKAFIGGGESAEHFEKRISDLSREIDKLGEKKAFETFLNQIDLLHGDAIENMTKDIKELAKDSPVAAQRVVDGFRDIVGNSAAAERATSKLQHAVDEGTAAHVRYAKNAKEAADGNAQIEDAATGGAAALAAQNKVLDAANQKLAGYADAAKGAKDVSADLASTLESQLAPKLDDVGNIFDDLVGATEKFTGDKLAAPDVSAYTDKLTETADATKHWADVVQFLFGQGLTGLASLVLQRGPSISQPLIEQIVNSGDEQRNAWNESLTTGLTAFATAKEQAKTLGTELSGSIAEGVKADPNDLLEAMKGKLGGLVRFSQIVGQLLSEGNTAIAAQLLGLGADAAAKYIDGLTSMSKEQRDALNANLVATQQALTDTQSTIDKETETTASLAGSLSEKLTAAYQSHLFHVPEDTDEAMLQAQAILNQNIPGWNTSGERLGTAAVDGTVQGIGGNVNKTKDATARLLQESTDSQLDYASSLGAGLGETYTAGTAIGIAGQRALAAAKAAIRNVIDQLDTEAHVYAGAASPAKRFIPLGEDITAGVGVGIERGMNRVATSFGEGIAGLHGHPDGGGLHGHRDGGNGRGGGWRDAPAPAAGVAPTIVQVVVDTGMLGAVDNSIHDLIVNNYGPDRDARASHMTRQMRSHQFLNAGV